MVTRRLSVRVSAPEGPVCLPSGDWLVASMGAGTLVWIDAQGRFSRTIASTGRPNGITRSSDGALWVAESLSPSLLRVTTEGAVSLVCSGEPSLPFLWPNDLCFGPDGGLYLTDSGVPFAAFDRIAGTPKAYDVPIDGRVFRVDPVSGRVTLIDRGLCFANGIAVGSDGALYVAETLTGNIFRYDLGGRLHREWFANVAVRPLASYGRVAGPDGMAFDQHSNLLVAVLEQAEIAAVDGNGRVFQRIALEGRFPTNIAFGRQGSRMALITEGSRNELLLMDWISDGLPLIAPTVSLS